MSASRRCWSLVLTLARVCWTNLHNLGIYIFNFSRHCTMGLLCNACLPCAQPSPLGLEILCSTLCVFQHGVRLHTTAVLSRRKQLPHSPNRVLGTVRIQTQSQRVKEMLCGKSTVVAIGILLIIRSTRQLALLKYALYELLNRSAT